MHARNLETPAGFDLEKHLERIKRESDERWMRTDGLALRNLHCRTVAEAYAEAVEAQQRGDPPPLLDLGTPTNRALFKLIVQIVREHERELFADLIARMTWARAQGRWAP